MAIAKNPLRNQSPANDRRAEAFISGAAKGEKAADDKTRDANKKPTTIRVDPELLARVERGAKRLGISVSAFFSTAAAEKLERMEG